MLRRSLLFMVLMLLCSVVVAQEADIRLETRPIGAVTPLGLVFVEQGESHLVLKMTLPDESETIWVEETGIKNESLSLGIELKIHPGGIVVGNFRYTEIFSFEGDNIGQSDHLMPNILVPELRTDVNLPVCEERSDDQINLVARGNELEQISGCISQSPELAVRVVEFLTYTGEEILLVTNSDYVIAPAGILVRSNTGIHLVGPENTEMLLEVDALVGPHPFTEKTWSRMVFIGTGEHESIFLDSSTGEVIYRQNQLCDGKFSRLSKATDTGRYHFEDDTLNWQSVSSSVYTEIDIETDIACDQGILMSEDEVVGILPAMPSELSFPIFTFEENGFNQFATVQYPEFGKFVVNGSEVEITEPPEYSGISTIGIILYHQGKTSILGWDGEYILEDAFDHFLYKKHPLSSTEHWILLDGGWVKLE